MTPGLKIGLGVAAGLAAGGAAGYFFAVTRAGRKALQAAEDVITDSGIRLPDPSFAMELPYTEEQFNVLDDLVCECGAPVVSAAGPEATIDAITTQIQECMAAKLYPDFSWPPISGDHPTAAQLYTELGVVARRALASAEICPRPIPSPTNVPIPQTNPGGYW